MTTDDTLLTTMSQMSHSQVLVLVTLVILRLSAVLLLCPPIGYKLQVFTNGRYKPSQMSPHHHYGPGEEGGREGPLPDPLSVSLCLSHFTEFPSAAAGPQRAGRAEPARAKPVKPD